MKIRSKCQYKFLSGFAWESPMQVYKEASSESTDAGAKVSGGSVESPEIKALKTRIREEDDHAELERDIVDYAAKETAKAEGRVKEGAFGVVDRWNRIVTMGPVTTAGATLLNLYKKGEMIDGAPSVAQQLLVDSQVKLEEKRDIVLARLESAKVELTQKVAQLNTAASDAIKPEK